MRTQAGLTLVEALIVIAIFGILAAIAIPAYIGFQDRARDSLTVNALGIVRTALEMHRAEDPFTYPQKASANWVDLRQDLDQYLGSADAQALADELPNFLYTASTPTAYIITANTFGSGSTITATRGGMHY
jgi:prepilin-type N-terminal cleavage/methylation domain-containing protein